MHNRLRWQYQTAAKIRLPLVQLSLALFLALFLSACTNPEAVRVFEQLAAQNQAILAAQGANATNRLLIQGADGNLYTVRPNGSERVALTNDATSLHQYLQPTWSPTGNKIAWSEIDARFGDIKSALTISQFNGLAREHFDTPYTPFYLQWSPDEQRLAYLSNWLNLDQTTTTIALRIVDLAAHEEKIRTLAEGQPLYLAWSPVGDRLLIHIDNDRLEFWDTAGQGAALSPTFAAFPAPQWSVDGDKLLYALGEPGTQQLVLSDVEGKQPQEITDFDQNISFSLSPSGDHVAYALSPAGVSTAAFGPLYVVELANNSTHELTSKPAMAFFWSPDGSKLAYLETDNSGDILKLRWQVWDGKSSKPYAAIVPSRIFLEAYLVFFDQYARGMTIWSPDSTAFAYPAVDDTAGNNIWVQQLDSAEPVKISSGVFVAWSPH
jgi:TolB protein